VVAAVTSSHMPGMSCRPSGWYEGALGSLLWPIEAMWRMALIGRAESKWPL
jgi:hypothetical protein